MQKETISLSHEQSREEFKLVTQKVKQSTRSFPSASVARYAIEEDLKELEKQNTFGKITSGMFAAIGTAALVLDQDNSNGGATVALMSAGLSSGFLILSHEKSRQMLLEQQLDYLKSIVNAKK